MNHDETKAAIHLSLLMGDTPVRASRLLPAP
jgi:hypothetical protein